MAIILSKNEAQALRDLISAGDRLWDSARTIRGTQRRLIVRTDAAMATFKRALDAAKVIDQDKLNVTRK